MLVAMTPTLVGWRAGRRSLNGCRRLNATVAQFHGNRVSAAVTVSPSDERLEEFVSYAETAAGRWARLLSKASDWGAAEAFNSSSNLARGHAWWCCCGTASASRSQEHAAYKMIAACSLALCTLRRPWRFPSAARYPLPSSRLCFHHTLCAQ